MLIWIVLLVQPRFLVFPSLMIHPLNIFTVSIGPTKSRAFNTIAEKPSIELYTSSKRLGKHNHPALFEYEFADFRLQIVLSLT